MTSPSELLSHLPLALGNHDDAQGRLCVMECVAYLAGERHSDEPACACEVITQVAIYANDNPDLLASLRYRQALGQRVLRLAGSKANLNIAAARFRFLLDRVMRVALPAAMEKASYHGLSEKFRALPDMKDSLPLAEIDKAITALLAGNPWPIASAAFNAGQFIKQISAHQYGAATKNLLHLVTAGRAKMDGIALLDDLLAIGAVPEEPVSGEMLARLSDLANRNTVAAGD